MHQVLRYWRAVRLAARESYEGGIWKSVEFWMLVIFSFIGAVGVLLLSWCLDDARRNSEFEQHAVSTMGQVVKERVCSNGTRFGSDYCYEILFTTRDGDEVTFSARGLTSYSAGMWIVEKPIPIQYLPYRPISARLTGTHGDGVWLLVMGAAITGFALFCLLGLIHALTVRYDMQVLLEKLETLMAERSFDQAADFAMAAPKAKYRETLLVTLILRMFALKEVQHAQKILARDDLPDLQEAFKAQGMQLRYGPETQA